MSVKPLFGIIGGLGPLSSAQFLNSIYLNCLDKFSVEQAYPRIILFSDPTIPDRTTAIRNQTTQEVTSSLDKKINDLKYLGVNKIIIACITAHYYLELLNSTSKENLIDMVNLLYDELNKSNEESLILSSLIVHDFKIIKHEKARYPSKEDVKRINDFIFKIKLNCNSDIFNAFIQLTKELALKYRVNSVIFACTELHLVNMFIKTNHIKTPYNIIDPLQITSNYIIKKST